MSEVRAPTWIEPGRLLAGGHPCASWAADAHESVSALLGHGVTLFVDLTEEAELAPYAALVPRGRSLRIPIGDFSVPSPAVIASALDAIDAELEAGGTVYVHCWAGCGRTGVIVGCWLVRHGLDPRDALAQTADARGNGCPQTAGQRAAVLEWEPMR